MAKETYDEQESVYYNLKTLLIDNDLTELFAIATEVIAARDGESSLLDQINVLQAAIAVLVSGSGVKVSSNDTTLGYLNGKLLAGEGIDFAEGNDGGDETLTLSCEDASTSNKGVLETATDAEAVVRSATDKAVTPANLAEAFKIIDYIIVPVEWPSDGVDSTAEPSAEYTDTNGKVYAREYAGDSTEDLIIPVRVPDDIVVADGIKFKVHCLVTAATGPSGEGVVFNLSGYSIGDGDSINGTFGTAVTSMATGMTHSQYDEFTTTLSGTVTITDLAQGEKMMLHLERDHDHASDTYVQNVGVSEVTIQITRLLAAA